ncbi:unnamed protein product [Closterium sp. NIES-54]
MARPPRPSCLAPWPSYLASLFDHVSGAAPAPPATADVSTRSQWLSRDATARLAIRNHLPATECAHFGEHRTAQALYNAVVARYSSPATTAIGRLLLPYLFPELSAFATVADLVTHLRTSNARYCATVPAEFLPTNQPPMFITLYFIVTCLLDSLRSIRDHFLTLDPTSLIVDLLEQHLLAAETSAVAVGAARGTPKLVLLRLVRSTATARARVAGVVEEAAVVVEVAVGAVVGAAVEEVEAVVVVAVVGLVAAVAAPVAAVAAPVAAVAAAEGVAAVEAVGPVVAELLRSGVAIFDLDFDVIISAMYALSFSAEGDCYRCVPPDPGIAAAALGASLFGTPPGTAPAKALHTFTLDSGAMRCFFRDSTTLTPLPAPVPVRHPDPFGGPVVASSSTVIPCQAIPSGSLSGDHLPSFSTNLVSTAALQDAMVTTTTPRGQHVSIYTCTWTGRHLATFTRRPGSSLYTLATEPPQVAASAQVSASGPVAASCSCRLVSHQTLLWHHRLGHPSLPCLRGMHSRSGLSRSLPPLPPSLAPPCLPCVKGRQRAAPHSSSFPPTSAPLQTLHMDVWGPARVSGQGRERYFLLVVDDYTRYTTVFPLHSKGEVSAVLIPWIRTVRLQLSERFNQDLPVLHLHSDKGGEFSFDLLRDFCRGEGITQSFTLPDTPQQNGIAERRIGLVIEVARTSMIHAAALHFLWLFAVQYAAHQLNLWPCVSLPETSPTLRWTGKVGDASVFRVWGSRAFVRDTSADKLSACAIPCAGDNGAEGAAITTGAGDPTEPGAAGAGGAGAGVAGVGGTSAGGAGAVGAGAVDPGAGGAGGTVRLRPYFVPLLRQVLGVLSSTGLPPPFPCPPPDQSQPPIQPASPLPVPSPYTEQSGGLTVRRKPASRPVSPVRTARCAPRSCPPSVLACGLDYASALVAESLPASPPSVGGECALGTDVLEERQEDFECLAAAVPRFASLLLALEGDPDAPDIPTPRSYAEAINGTYVDEVPPPRANIVDGMWIFRLKWPPGSPPAFKARYVARGFSQRQGVDYFQTFSPTPKMTTLRVLLHVAAQRDYELQSLDFSTAFLQGSLHKEIWLRRPPGFTGTTTLAALGFAPSTGDPSLFLRTDTSLPPFYVLVYVDDLVFALADTDALTLVKSELQK